MTLIFLIAVATLWGLAGYSGTLLSVTVLVALLVTLIPTTIGGLLSAIGIAGMDRLMRFNVMATSGRAVEAAGDVDTLLLDKTGTITFGNRLATAFIPVPGVTERNWRRRRSLPPLPMRRRKAAPSSPWQGELRHRRATWRPRTASRAFLGDDAHFRHRSRWPQHPQRCGRCHTEACRHDSRNRAAGLPRRPSIRSRALAARRWRWPRTASSSASSI